MIKVFILNENNKIELTKQELQKLLDESYWEGRNSVYTSPSWTYISPTKWTCGTELLNQPKQTTTAATTATTKTITVGAKQNEI